MKKYLMILVTAPILVINACNNATGNSEKPATVADTASEPSKATTLFRAVDTTKLAKGTVFYQCSMHPEIIADKDGDCPKCGMRLVMKHKITE